MGYSIEAWQEGLPTKRRGPWKHLIDRDDTFTEAKWRKLQSSVAQFIKLETERRRIERCSNRKSRLEQLFNSLRQAELGGPTAVDWDELTAAQRLVIIANWVPLPCYSDALKWSVIQGLIETDVPIDETASRFDEHLGEIKQLMKDWGKQVKRGWANAVREGRESEGLVADPPCQLEPTNEVELSGLLASVDLDTVLLLRADTFFGTMWQFHTYDELVRKILKGERLYQGDYKFHTRASAVARTLLASLRFHDASSLEFCRDSSQWFACGRCYSPKKTWISMVEHYVELSLKWDQIESQLRSLPEIKYHNTHDLTSLDNVKPPINWLFLPQEVAKVDARFARLKEISWIEQVAEELGVAPPSVDCTTLAGDK
ncbi:hypothetical protein FRC07_011998, partial [Ceratobasidium sp. 392]